jgi:hypothetical protein
MLLIIGLPGHRGSMDSRNAQIVQNYIMLYSHHHPANNLYMYCRSSVLQSSLPPFLTHPQETVKFTPKSLLKPEFRIILERGRSPTALVPQLIMIYYASPTNIPE